MKKLLISLLAAGLITTFSAHAAPADHAIHAAHATSLQPQEAMTMQVIKEELNLTKESFKSVRLIEQPNGGYSVEVVLTPKAAKKMRDLTASNIKNRVNIGYFLPKFWQHMDGIKYTAQIGEGS